MNLIELEQNERKLARLLLEEERVWEEEYISKLKKKYPDITQEKLRNKVLIASDRKFRNNFTKFLKIKIKRIIYTQKLIEEGC